MQYHGLQATATRGNYSRCARTSTGIQALHSSQKMLLRIQEARIYDIVHVSGHLSQEGHHDMLDALQP